MRRPRAALAAALLLAAVPARAVELQRGDDRWICAQTTADGGECVGRFEIRYGNGTVGEYGTTADGRRWTGPQHERYPDGGEQRCSGSSPQYGLCIGEVEVRTADGTVIRGQRAVRDKQSPWTGRIRVRTGDGIQLDCQAAAAEEPGLCDGEASLRFPDGSVRHGRMQPSATRDGNDWTGPFRERRADGSRFECGAATARGACNGAARFTRPDGSRREAHFVDGVEVEAPAGTAP